MIKVYDYATFDVTYKQLLTDLISAPQNVVAPRNQKCYEIQNVCLSLSPLHVTYKNSVRSTQMKYVSAELLWYFSGLNDIDFIQKYASMWSSIAEDNKVNSAYGYQLFTDINEHGITEWQWALQQIGNDVDTRQAVMHINKPKHNYKTKDYPCTLTITFNIRQDKLNMNVHMRSNDAILGLPTDIVCFSMFHQQMHRHLLQSEILCELGEYTHFVDSMHIYERHFDVVRDMLKHDFTEHDQIILDTDLVDIDGKPTFDINNLYTLPKSNITDMILSKLL